MVMCPTDGCQGKLLKVTLEEEDYNGKVTVRIQYEACEAVNRALHKKFENVRSIKWAA